jgi:hypothetical protein
MANRPCKPDADTKRLWQMLMPGVPMPACGVGQEPDQEALKAGGQDGRGDDRSAADPGKGVKRARD